MILSEILMTPLPEKPFFIIGHPRSGTTLLRFMMGSHPRLFIPDETGFIPFLLKEKQINSPLTIHQVEHILNRIGQLNFIWRDKVRDIPNFYTSLPEPTLAHVLDHLFRYHTTNQPVIRWGDKTPLYVQYIHIIDKIFPNAQFIHLIRDGRDAALSALKKWPESSSYMDMVYLLKNWVRNIKAGQLAGEKLGPQHYYELYYEKLVSHPEESIKELCGFLGEEYHPAMMDHTNLARQIGPGPHGHIEVLEPVSTASVGRWKSKMTGFEKKIAYRVAGTMLAQLGYDAGTNEVFTFFELLHYEYKIGRFLMVDTVRSILYRTGIFTLNRTMRK